MRGLALFFLLFAAAAIAQPPRPRVVEAFQVGPDVYVRALAVEPARGVLWVGTSVGLNEVDLQSGKLRATFTRRDGLASEQVFAVAIDAQGSKWVGTGSGGASRYRRGGREGAWKTYFPMHGLADYRVFSLAPDARGGMWMGTLAGASRLDLATGKFTNYAKQLVNEWVYGIAVDRKERVWFATEGGVSMFDGKAWRAWTQDDGVGLPNPGHASASGPEAPAAKSYNRNYIFAVHAARDGTIWAGTWGGGVARLDGERWTALTARDGLAGDMVYSIAEEPDGTMWFGTNAGVSSYDGKKFTNVGAKQGLAGENIFALAVAAKTREIWAGSRGSVSRLARR